MTKFKRSYAFFIWMAGLFFISSCTDKNQPLQITGTIEGLKQGTFRFYSLAYETEDSATITDGKFVFTKDVKLMDIAYLWFTEPNGKRHMIGLPIPVYRGDKLVIEGRLEDIEHSTIKGSEEVELTSKLRTAVQPTIDEYMATFRNYRDPKTFRLTEEGQKKIKALTQDLNQKVYSFIDEHPKKLSATAAFLYASSYNSVDEDTVYRKEMEGRMDKFLYGNSDITLMFGNMISKMFSRSPVVNQDAPDFTQNDVHGKPVSLSSFKGKYVLIDFWASWCGPCRHENPNVVKAYKKFKAKNFEVLGVSLDKDKDAWTKAIEKDGLTWTQVGDLKGWENEVAQLYVIRSIPSNFLVDPQGKIIATGLRGEDLEQFLEKNLK